MLGWVFDTSALTACRSFGVVLGHLPYACQTNAGRPFLILIGGVLVLLFALVLAVRAYRTR